MIKIVKANKSHKKIALELLDEFRTACGRIIYSKKDFVSSSAKKQGGPFFDKVSKSRDYVIFLAKKDGKYIGIVTAFIFPQIRHGQYCAEIEEMYVIDEFQGKGVAKKLVDAVIKWSKNNKVRCVRLESANELKRAHAFYKKCGFRFYGRAYEKLLK